MDNEQEKEDNRLGYNLSGAVPEAPETEGETRESIGTVEPWEESDRARGFQNGSWNYNQDARNRQGGTVDTEDSSDEPE